MELAPSKQITMSSSVVWTLPSCRVEPTASSGSVHLDVCRRSHDPYKTQLQSDATTQIGLNKRWAARDGPRNLTQNYRTQKRWRSL